MPDESSAAAETSPAALTSADEAALKRLQKSYHAIRSELSKVIVGQHEVIDQLLIALFSRGHVILEGVPGLAKTLMISSLAKCLSLKFHRIQFTPDLMPSDITGTEVIQEDKRTGERAFRFLPGPVFTNVLLADEVNRTPPKTQAALLEAMAETQVSIGGVIHPIEDPFFVLATQNPIEQEGTYPLPEAQQDRFMFKVFVSYPTYDDEYSIAERTTSGDAAELKPILTRDDIIEFQRLVRRLPAPPSALHHALALVRLTRPHHAEAEAESHLAPDGAQPPATDELIERMVTYGAGPRAVQFLMLAAKARAAILGRSYVADEDIDALAKPVLRHRIVTNYSAEAEGVSTDHLIEHVLATLTQHGREMTDAGLREVLKS